jgi:hypothetical protein
MSAATDWAADSSMGDPPSNAWRAPNQDVTNPGLSALMR